VRDEDDAGTCGEVVMNGCKFDTCTLDRGHEGEHNWLWHAYDIAQETGRR
jgi:hypothetical protein